MIQLQSTHIIRYLPHHEIDKAKWDACLLASHDPLIYASSVYLDAMCKHWDALVMNDYEAIMPLPYNRKWSISYIYSPYYVIAVGVFGKDVSAEMVLQFIQAVPQRFKYIDLDLHEQNFFANEFLQHNISYKTRHNTFLDLNADYKTLYSHYSTLAKRKIKKAAKYNLQADVSFNVKRVIELYKKYYKNRDTVITRFDFADMISLLGNSMAQQTKTYILSFPDGSVCAFYLLLFDASHVYWLLGGSTDEGKESGAFYYLTDTVIKDFSGSARIFRFEGSDHEGIRFFNQQFGGKSVLYPHLTINRLPPIIRYLKP